MRVKDVVGPVDWSEGENVLLGVRGIGGLQVLGGGALGWG